MARVAHSHLFRTALANWRRAVRCVALSVCMSAVTAAYAEAQDVTDRYQYIGSARLFSNDAFGDGRDRWRTGSYRASFGFVPPTSSRIAKFFRMIEFRGGAEVVTPEKLSTSIDSDRRYAGILNLGVRGHAVMAQDTYVTSGLDVYVVGPQTNLYRIQEAIHRALGMPYSERAAELQIEDKVYLAVNNEFARTYDLGRASARPFIETHIGMETYVRGGLDLTIGDWPADRLVTRDITTGHLLPFVQNAQRVTVTMGVDWAHVVESRLLGDIVRQDRFRARFGINAHEKESRLFFGMAYLGPEAIDQGNGQLVGSVSFNFSF